MSNPRKSKRGNGSGTIFKRRPDPGSPWYIAWYDHERRRREQCTLTTDRATAGRMLARKVDETAQRVRGLIDPKAEALAEHGRRPIGEHLADWRADLAAKDRTGKTVKLVTARVQRMVDALHAQRIGDVAASAVQAAIGAMIRDGLALQTAHHYLRAVKQFSRWLHRDGRTPADALAHLQGYNASTDRRHERRALNPDELARVIDAAECGPVVLGMSGPDRAMLYRVAAGTGFRAGELASLTPDSFDVDANPPTVTVRAAYSKRRRDDVQPIRPDLAELLRPWLAGKPVGCPVFDLPDKTAKMLRSDLDAAGVPYADAAGRVVDFHALRHTFITAVVNSGASVKVAQELARHSTPTLTIGRYAHARLHDLTRALDALPCVTRPDHDRQTMRATGTHDATPGEGFRNPYSNRHAKPCDAVRSVAVNPLRLTDDGVSGKAYDSAEICEPVRSSATLNDQATCRTRTGDLRFTKPLLYQLS